MSSDEGAFLQEPEVEPVKRKGRPKGSKNKAKDAVGYSVENVDTTVSIPGFNWSYKDPVVEVRLLAADVPEGLLSTILQSSIVGVSELPNGGTSLITNIGGLQPLILTSITPYEEVKKAVFG